jgi:hypothetical protein
MLINRACRRLPSCGRVCAALRYTNWLSRRDCALSGVALTRPRRLRPSTSAWCGTVATELLFEPPGAGKSHLDSAIGHALIDNGYRVMFTRTSELVQKLQTTRQSLQLPSTPAEIDRSELIGER